MTRRAKLNLTPNDNKAQKQPASFDIEPEQVEATPDQDEATRVSSGKKPNSNESTNWTSANSGAQHSTKPNENFDKDVHSDADTASVSYGSPTTWLNKKTLLKAALVVGAAAVTVYLIKRRFR